MPIAKVDEFQALIEHYHTMVCQNPDHIKSIINLAWSYERVGQYQAASQRFQRALDIDQRDFDAHYGLGLALLGADKPREALSQFICARDLATSGNTNRSESVMIGKQVEVFIRRLS